MTEHATKVCLEEFVEFMFGWDVVVVSGQDSQLASEDPTPSAYVKQLEYKLGSAKSTIEKLETELQSQQGSSQQQRLPHSRKCRGPTEWYQTNRPNDEVRPFNLVVC